MNYILLGDFNIISPEHETMQALRNHGFVVPDGMEKLATSLSKEKRHYDQIPFRLSDRRFKFGACGKIDYRDVVFRDEDAAHYIDVVKPKRFEKKSNGQTRDRTEREKYFRQFFRKHQMSDHQLCGVRSGSTMPMIIWKNWAMKAEAALLEESAVFAQLHLFAGRTDSCLDMATVD